jgi:hypothetical protein
MVLIESAMRRLGNQMAGKLLLTFKEKPSFEGELSVALMEEHDPEGRARYFLVCQKEPPFNTEEIVLIAAREGIVDDQHDELMKSISWQREVPAAEASAILDILQHQIAFIIPEATIGLDGTTYELLIERGFSKVQFTWWCDPPLGWKALGEVANKILSRTDSISALESLQTNERKQSIKQLREKLDELHAKRKKEKEELIRMHNRRCQELASSLEIQGLTCPRCNYHSKDIRFVDRSPGTKSYFICSACGRSFRPEDLQPAHT